MAISGFFVFIPLSSYIRAANRGLPAVTGRWVSVQQDGSSSSRSDLVPLIGRVLYKQRNPPFGLGGVKPDGVFHAPSARRGSYHNAKQVDGLIRDAAFLK